MRRTVFGIDDEVLTEVAARRQAVAASSSRTSRRERSSTGARRPGGAGRCRISTSMGGPRSAIWLNRSGRRARSCGASGGRTRSEHSTDLPLSTVVTTGTWAPASAPLYRHVSTAARCRLVGDALAVVDDRAGAVADVDVHVLRRRRGATGRRRNPASADGHRIDGVGRRRGRGRLRQRPRPRAPTAATFGAPAVPAASWSPATRPGARRSSTRWPAPAAGDRCRRIAGSLPVMGPARGRPARVKRRYLRAVNANGVPGARQPASAKASSRARTRPRCGPRGVADDLHGDARGPRPGRRRRTAPRPGWLGRPRCGTGARYGLSVSTRSAVERARARPPPGRRRRSLNVTMPEKLRKAPTVEARAGPRRARR